MLVDRLKTVCTYANAFLIVPELQPFGLIPTQI